MLKRYQVLLPEWLEEYVKIMANKHDLSFSEIIRAELCFSVLSVINHLYPEYKPGLNLEEILNKIKFEIPDAEREDIHRIISKIYFETRKAVEYRMNKEKKSKKK